MKELKICAKLRFYDLSENQNIQKRKFENKLIVDFLVREDMYSSGQIILQNKDYAYPGENDVFAIIKFPHGKLLSSYVEAGKRFIFGEIGFPYGEGNIIEIIE